MSRVHFLVSRIGREMTIWLKTWARSRQVAAPSITQRIDRIEEFVLSLAIDKEGVALHHEHIMPFPTRGLELISSYNGIPFFSIRGQEWVQARTGERLFVNQSHDSIPPWQNERSSWPDPSARHPVELPDISITQECIDIFLISPVCLVFPLVDITLHLKTISNVYHPLQSRLSDGFTNRNASRASIFAFLAFCSIIDMGITPRIYVDGEAYAAEAHRLLPEILRETPTLDGLQSLLMLALYHTLSGDSRSVDILIGNATRLIFMLGGNLCYEDTNLMSPSPNLSDLSFRTRCHLRNLFWICYVLDKELFLRTGRPPSLCDDDCDLTFPMGYSNSISVDQIPPQLSAGPEARPLLFPTDLNLSIITSKIYRSLFSAKALRKSDTELLRTIRELDEDLQKWKGSLLASDRMLAHLSNETQSEPVTDIRSIMLRVQYYHCVAAIHQASHRCKARNGDFGETRNVVYSSQELSVEASRSLILFLRGVKHALSEDYIWFVSLSLSLSLYNNMILFLADYHCGFLLFYPLSALLSIFCNLLQNPKAPQTAKDLELLSEVSLCLRRAGLDVQSPNDNSVGAPIGFITKLNRLALCAFLKVGTGHS
ncbi:Zn(II)2Cys6 transcription factor [Penicillium concentricum]|uniref:Zn(II)2Cys6 transcription factor n=1 Tax=Penicillium concentricum TaxID=293559 RepID=A0A9W9R967_9EURO|nr:Zn(II)2Cys6 transcription factor [Penicillium concentricum]KAJ5355848.1 Zn(II)2Cys6 transcription factor [Penicillium concentricum]